MLFRERNRKKKEERLIKAVINGDETAFRELLIRYQTGIYNFVYRFLGNSEEAEDITQETFLKLFRSIERLKMDIGISAFLYSIARNLCIDFKRKRKIQSSIVIEDSSKTITPLDHLTEKERNQHILSELNKLPENQSTALYLCYSEGFSYLEISEIMDITISAVESLLFRGRKNLRNRLEKIKITSVTG